MINLPLSRRSQVFNEDLEINDDTHKLTRELADVIICHQLTIVQLFIYIPWKRFKYPVLPYEIMHHSNI